MIAAAAGAAGGLWVLFRDGPGQRSGGVLVDDGPAADGRGAGKRPRTRAPRLLTSSGSSPGELEVVPGRPGYDPTKFRGLISLPDLYQQEPRNDSWAAPVERALRELVAADLRRAVPGIALLDVTCKTTVCSISWRGEAQARRLLERTMPILLPGSRSTVVRGETDRFYLALYGGEVYGDLPVNNPTAAIARLKETRARFTRKARTPGSLLNLLNLRIPVPTNIWPTEEAPPLVGHQPGAGAPSASPTVAVARPSAGAEPMPGPVSASAIELLRHGSFDVLVMNNPRLHVVKRQALGIVRRLVDGRCGGLHFSGPSTVAMPLKLTIAREKVEVSLAGPAEVERGAPIGDRLRSCLATVLTGALVVSSPGEDGLWSGLPDAAGETFLFMRFRADGTIGRIP